MVVEEITICSHDDTQGIVIFNSGSEQPEITVLEIFQVPTMDGVGSLLLQFARITIVHTTAVTANNFEYFTNVNLGCLID